MTSLLAAVLVLGAVQEGDDKKQVPPYDLAAALDRLREGDPEALESALEAIDDGSLRGEDLERFVRAVSSWASGPALRRLQQAFEKSEDAGRRAELLDAIGRLGGGNVVPLMGRHVDDPQDDVSKTARDGLFRYAGRAHAAELRKLLQHDDPDLRFRAAETLLRIDAWESAVIKVYEAELQESDPRLRERAVVSLGDFRRKEAMDLLVERLDDDDAQVREKTRLAVYESLAELFPYLEFDAAASAPTIRDWWKKNRPK